MNHRGETRELGAIAQPTIAIVNNAQREHQEFMASVDEVAAEHADAILALRPRGTAVINADDAHADDVARGGAQRRRARWSTSASTTGADVSARCTLRAGRQRHRAAHLRRQRAGRTARARAAHGQQRAGGDRRARSRRGCRWTRSCAASRRSGRWPGGCRRCTRSSRRAGHRRHVQRESGFRARGHRRARARAGRQVAGAGRHGRSRRAGPGVPSRNRRVRARSAASSGCSRPATCAAKPSRRSARAPSTSATVVELAARVQQAATRRRDGAGQGLAVDAHGARGRGAHRPGSARESH